MATIRLDGFASLAAGFDGGCVTTNPFIFDGSALLLNAKANFFASVRVEALDQQGHPIPGYTLEESVPMTEDRVDYVVRWNNRKDISKLSGRPIKLRFYLTNSRLYSYQIRRYH